MDQDQYRQILIHQMQPSMNHLFPDSQRAPIEEKAYFQQDNDPKHTALSVRRYFDNANIRLMDWPSQSPDLNPIENLWSIFDLKIKDRKCSTEEELYDVIRQAWYELPVDLLTSLVHSMPRRCQAVIDSMGYPAKY